MRFCCYSLFALCLLTGKLWAAEPVRTDPVQAQAEQTKKQSFADAIWRYLSASSARMRQLDEAVNRLYSLAFTESTEQQANSTSLGLPVWQEALAPLRALNLTPATAISLKTLEQDIKEAARVLAAIPAVATDAPPERRIERQQALVAAASALGLLQQRAVSLDSQLEVEARRADSAAHLLGTQILMRPAPAKEKP